MSCDTARPGLEANHTRGDDAWVPLDDCGLRVMTPGAFEARFGVAVEPPATWGAAFSAIVLGVESLARFDAAVSAGGAFDTVLEDSGRRVVRNAAFDTTLEARSAR